MIEYSQFPSKEIIKKLDLSYSNETFTTSVDNMEAMTITEQLHENVLDDPNAEKIVIIPLRSKKVKGKLFLTSNALDNR